MKEILFVSIAFPPKNDPECLQVAKYFKYLSTHPDFNLSVVTSASPTLFMPYDKALAKYDSGYIQKIEIPIFEAKISNFFLRKVLSNGIDYPDSKFSFHWQYKRVIKKLKSVPELIYSRANPLSSSVMAYKLKKHFKIPWIMHLSDPWVDSPLHHYTASQHKYHSQLESECFKAADAISFTSVETQEFYKMKYPDLSDRMLYFPNVYDAEDINENAISFDEKLRIVYTGGLTSTRSPKSFIEAFQKFNRDFPQFKDIVHVVFAGPMDRTVREILDTVQSPSLKHIGFLSYMDARALQRSATILLNIDPPLQNEARAFFFPSKILDYLLENKKILSISNQNSASSRIIRKINGSVFEHGDTGGMVQFLCQASQNFIQKNENYFKVNTLPEEFDAKINAERLSDVILRFLN